MTIQELINELNKYPPNTEVYKSKPVEGDSENVREFTKIDFYFENRYPAFVIF